jgi:hypothetical protein
MRHFPGLRKVRQTVFLRCGKLSLGRGTLMRRCVADSGYFLALAAGFWGTPASPPNSPWPAMQTGAWPRRRSTATEALPNQSMPVARPVPGVASGGPRRPPGQARRPSRTRWIEQSDPRLACPNAERKHQNGRESPYARGDTGAEIQLPGRRAGLPKALRSLNAESGQKTLRDRAFREIVW